MSKHVTRVKIELREGQPLKAVLSKFNKKVDAIGHIQYLLDNKHFKPKWLKRKLKAKNNARTRQREMRNLIRQALKEDY